MAASSSGKILSTCLPTVGKIAGRIGEIVRALLKVGIVFMNEDGNGEKTSIQMLLNRLHDEWIISVTNGDLEASDRLWHEMDVVYQKLRDLLPITPTG